MAIFKLDVLGLLLQCNSPQGIYSKFKKKIFKKKFLFSAYGFFKFFFCSRHGPPVLNYKPKTISKGACYCIIKIHLVNPSKV